MHRGVVAVQNDLKRMHGLVFVLRRHLRGQRGRQHHRGGTSRFTIGRVQQLLKFRKIQLAALGQRK